MRCCLTFLALVIGIFLALSPAQAARHYHYSGWGTLTITLRHHVRPHRHISHIREARQAHHRYAAHRMARHPRAEPVHELSHAEGVPALNVVSSAVDKFRGLVTDLIGLGFNVGHPGCYSATGHMPHSKHHWGGACDLFNQIARNKTALPQPEPSVQIELAAKHGLTSGCQWKHPDCGHFELPGALHGAYAMHRRHHHRTRHAMAMIARNPNSLLN